MVGVLTRSRKFRHGNNRENETRWQRQKLDWYIYKQGVSRTAGDHQKLGETDDTDPPSEPPDETNPASRLILELLKKKQKQTKKTSICCCTCSFVVLCSGSPRILAGKSYCCYSKINTKSYLISYSLNVNVYIATKTNYHIVTTIFWS